MMNCSRCLQSAKYGKELRRMRYEQPVAQLLAYYGGARERDIDKN